MLLPPDCHHQRTTLPSPTALDSRCTTHTHSRFARTHSVLGAARQRLWQEPRRRANASLVPLLLSLRRLFVPVSYLAPALLHVSKLSVRDPLCLTRGASCCCLQLPAASADCFQSTPAPMAAASRLPCLSRSLSPCLPAYHRESLSSSTSFAHRAPLSLFAQDDATHTERRQRALVMGIFPCD